MKIQSYKWGIAGIIVLATTCTLLAFTGGPQHPDTVAKSEQDTIPRKKSKATRLAGDRDFDMELRAIDGAREEFTEKDRVKMQHDLDEAMSKINFENIQADIDKAMKSVDFEKMNRDIAKSMAMIDMKKMNIDIEAAMKNIDFSKINKEIEESMKKIDFDKMNKELRESLSEIDAAKMQKEIKESIDQAMKVDMEKVKDQLSNLKIDLDNEKFDLRKTMEIAEEGIAKAKVELKGYQEMVYAMEAEGLLDTKGDYTIEYRSNEISINGKKQSAAVSEKYKKYFKRDKTTIKKENGEIDIKYGSSNTHID